MYLYIYTYAIMIMTKKKKTEMKELFKTFGIGSDAVKKLNNIEKHTKNSDSTTTLVLLMLSDRELAKAYIIKKFMKDI